MNRVIFYAICFIFCLIRAIYYTTTNCDFRQVSPCHAIYLNEGNLKKRRAQICLHMKVDH